MQSRPLGQLEQPILLAVVLQALRAGEDRVVVREDDAPGAVLREQVAVDRAQARHQPVGRRPGDQVVDRPAAALRRDDQRAVLDECPRVAEVLDVLPRRALPGRPAAGHHVRPGRVEPDGVAVEHLTQIGPDPVEVQPRAAGLLRHRHVQRLEEGQRVALGDGVALLGQPTQHAPAAGGDDDVLHLHGLHDEERLPGVDEVAARDEEGHHRALERGGHADGAVRAGDRSEPRRRARRRRLGVIEHGERVHGVDAGAHEPRAVRRRRGRFGCASHQLGQVVVDERRRRLARGHLRPLQQGDEE